MAIEKFPPVEHADEYGLLAAGGDLEVASLLLAYQSGIFPWPLGPEFPLTWFAPPKRAVLFVNEFHLSRSFKKFLKQCPWTICVDTHFEQVIEGCALSKRSRGAGTWISQEIIDAYCELHRAGYAHSFEVFDGERLVGGLYGVSINGMFAGESMFHLETNASKVALWSTLEFVKERGSEWIDCQVKTPFLSSLGARDISREQFTLLLQETLARPPLF